MRKVLLTILVMAAFVFASAPFGAPSLKDQPVYAQGKIKIQLTETAQSSGMLMIDNSSKSYSTTGFKSIDILNAKHSVTRVKNAHMGAKNKDREKKLGLDRGANLTHFINNI